MGSAINNFKLSPLPKSRVQHILYLHSHKNYKAFTPTVWDRLYNIHFSSGHTIFSLKLTIVIHILLKFLIQLFLIDPLNMMLSLFLIGDHCNWFSLIVLSIWAKTSIITLALVNCPLPTFGWSLFKSFKATKMISWKSKSKDLIDKFLRQHSFKTRDIVNSVSNTVPIPSLE